MQYTSLGRSGRHVSRLALGTMNFGELTSETGSFEIMDMALEAAVRFGKQAKAAGPLRCCRCGSSSIAHNWRNTRRCAGRRVRSRPPSRWLGYSTTPPSRLREPH